MILDINVLDTNVGITSHYILKVTTLAAPNMRRYVRPRDLLVRETGSMKVF